MTPPDDVLRAARRLYTGCAIAMDDQIVTGWLAKTDQLPKDPGAKAFWVLSLHAQAVTKSRYASVREWLKS